MKNVVRKRISTGVQDFHERILHQLDPMAILYQKTKEQGQTVENQKINAKINYSIRLIMI